LAGTSNLFVLHRSWFSEHSWIGMWHETYCTDIRNSPLRPFLQSITSFLLQINAHNMLNTCVNISPFTCYMFWCLLQHHQADHCVTCS